MADLQQVGQMLGGFSAGLQGQLPAFIQNRQNQQRLDMTQQAMDAETAEKAAAKKVEMDAMRQKAYAQDVQAVSRLLEMGNIDAAFNLLGERAVMLSQMGSDDPSDTATMFSLASAAKNGDQRALELLKGEVQVQNTINQARGLVEMPKQEAFTLSPGQRRYSGDQMIAEAPAEPETGYRILAPEEAAQMGLDPAKRYQQNTRTQQISQVGGGDTNIQMPKAENAYLSGRASAQAASMGELEKAAESAFKSNQALDQFIAASAKGDAGGAQPVITGVKNFLSSFGFSADDLADTAKMEQAIGQILGAKMAELGARGLTDRDMDVLRQALPRVNTSPEARVEIANVIKKSNAYLLNEYDQAVKFEQESYPEYRFRRPSWHMQQGAQNLDDPLGIMGQ